MLENLDQPIYPKQILEAQAGVHPRRIEDCPGFRRVRIDFDLPHGTLPADPRLRSFVTELIRSIKAQGHPEPGRPSYRSDMVIGFANIPSDCGPLFEGVPEVPPMMWEASKHYLMKAFKQNYVAIVAHDQDIAALPKRKMEIAMRRLMTRLGAYKVLNIHPDYFALATMEGGLAVEERGHLEAIDRLRNRLVTHACAREAGSYEKKPDIIADHQWEQTAAERGYLVETFRQLGTWGNIDQPFDIRSVASKERARLAERLEQMGWSRQSESAGAMVVPMKLPSEYLVEGSSCVVLSTATGRGRQVDKRNMDPETDLVAVSVRRREASNVLTSLMRRLTARWSLRDREDPFGLSNFQRLALGRVGFPIVPPSVEFDEMAAAILNSPIVRVSRHPDGRGYIRDPNGPISFPALRALIHTHNGVERIDPHIIYGQNALMLVEYIPANFKVAAYHVGCGRDQTLAISLDAVGRSRAIQDPYSPFLMAFFNAFGHADNLLVATKPLPGTDYIPADPLAEVLLPLIDKDTGPVRLTEELARV